MTVLLALGLGAFAVIAVGRFRLMRVACAPDDRFDRSDARIDAVVRFVFGQQRMFRYAAAGTAHALIFGGFVVLLLRTLILFARGYSSDPGFGFALFDDGTVLGTLYLFCKDIVGVLVIAGVLYFLWSRLVIRPKRVELSAEGIFILCMILGIILSDMTYEAAGFVRDARHGATLAHAGVPAASLLAHGLQRLPETGVDNLYYLGFWLHGIIVLLFLNFLPFGKHFHILTVLPNVYFRNLDGIGRLAPVDDIDGKLEREETLGVKTVRDLSWKSVLDLYTCTECGRCSDHCPAFNTGKLLSPKHLTIGLRDQLYANAGELVRGTGIGDRGTGIGDRVAGNGDRGSGIGDRGSGIGDRVGRASRPLESDINSDPAAALQPLVPHAVDPEMLWACTTCGACEQECPVLISYVDKIVDMRRNLVMEQGEFPAQLQNAFRGLETVGNPYSMDNEQRGDWAAGLDVPLLADNPGAEYLYWVGCAPSFDDRSRKIARAFVQLLQIAGVDFAILGPREKCTGDPARRAGNEYLFQMLANENVETLNSAGVRKIVSTCPHCYNTIKNEYPELGGKFEVLHHTELLARLIRAGALEPAHEVPGRIVYHDSCYIGRYNDVYDPPREILASIPGLELVEAVESRDRGMCCGAGGAQMWKEDEPIRRDDPKYAPGKVNHARTRQLLSALGGQVRASGSPGRPTPSRGGGRSDRGRSPGAQNVSLPIAQPASSSSSEFTIAPASSTIATACPFCKTMLSDGLTDQGHDNVTQQDVAEILLRAVQGEANAAQMAGAQSV